MIFPTRKDITNLNRYHIQHTGGLHQGTENLLNPGSLEWVLNCFQYPLFGVDRYPTLVEKAALLAWTIVAGHIFHDGNKRTGISTLKAFLRANSYDIEASDDELIQVALGIAGGGEEDYPLGEFTQWIRNRLHLRV